MTKKALLPILLCLLWAAAAQAQTLRGTVLDSLTRQPVQGVSVYLDGSSVYTVTDAQGKFELSIAKKLNTSVVFSHISYETRAFPYPYTQLPETLLLGEKIQQIKEVVVGKDMFSRNRKLAVFRSLFLGETAAGKDCTIKNEDDIDVWYNVLENTLNASCEGPILIENKYLGYTIRYDLENFQVHYNRRSIEAPDWIRSDFKGRASFQEPQKPSKKIVMHRNRIYQRSRTRFFYDLTHDLIGTKQSDFSIVNRTKAKLDPHPFFSVTDSLQIKLVTIKVNPDTDIDLQRVLFLEEDIYGLNHVMYRGAVHSIIVFCTPSFLVDDYGNIDQRAQVIFAGDMGRQLIGNLLPYDFNPE